MRVLKKSETNVTAEGNDYGQQTQYLKDFK